MPPIVANLLKVTRGCRVPACGRGVGHPSLPSIRWVAIKVESGGVVNATGAWDQLEQTQRLVLTPELRQAIAILQLGTVDLAQYVENEMLENPLLEQNDEEPAIPGPRRATPGLTGSPTCLRASSPTTAIRSRRRWVRGRMNATVGIDMWPRFPASAST